VEGLDKNLLAGLFIMSIERPLHLRKSLAQTSAIYAGILALVAHKKGRILGRGQFDIDFSADAAA
jgi:hypothetical protein